MQLESAASLPPPEMAEICTAGPSGPRVLAHDMLTADGASLGGTVLLEVSPINWVLGFIFHSSTLKVHQRCY